MELNSEIIYRKLNEYPFFRMNGNIQNFETLSFATQAIDVDFTQSIAGFDASSMIQNVIYEEAIQTIFKNSVKDLLNTNIYDYMFLEDVDLDYSLPLQLVHKILDKQYENMIVTGMIGASLQDTAGFQIIYDDTKSSLETNGVMYKMGLLRGMNIWVDPYMRYNDHRIIFFNHIDYNIGRSSNFEYSEPGMISTRRRFNLEFKSIPSQSEILYLIKDKNDPQYLDYLRILRDQKIDKIVD